MNAGAEESAVTGDDPPQSKKQKSEGALDLGGPMEDEESARQKLEKAGFDPGAVNEAVYVTDEVWAHYEDGEEADEWEATPLIYFCRAGDVKMCRYLIAKGASITKFSDKGSGHRYMLPHIRKVSKYASYFANMMVQKDKYVAVIMVGHLSDWCFIQDEAQTTWKL